MTWQEFGDYGGRRFRSLRVQVTSGVGIARALGADAVFCRGRHYSNHHQTHHQTHMSQEKPAPTTGTLGLTGLTMNAMALIAPGAFLWLTFQEQSLYGAPLGRLQSMWFGIRGGARPVSRHGLQLRGTIENLSRRRFVVSLRRAGLHRENQGFQVRADRQVFHWLGQSLVLLGLSRMHGGGYRDLLRLPGLNQFFPRIPFSGITITTARCSWVVLVCVVFAPSAWPHIKPTAASRAPPASTRRSMSSRSALRCSSSRYLPSRSLIACEHGKQAKSCAIYEGWHLSNGTAINYQVDSVTPECGRRFNNKPVQDTWARMIRRLIPTPKVDAKDATKQVADEKDAAKDKDGKSIPVYKQQDPGPGDQGRPGEQGHPASGGLQREGDPYPVLLQRMRTSGKKPALD